MMNRKTVLIFLLAACALGSRGADSFELTPSEEEALRLAKQGTIVSLQGIASLRQRLPAIAIERSGLPGPPLLFSDMPEYLHDRNGLCLAENVAAGACRLYIYHVPGTTNSSRTVSAVIENLSSRPLTVRFTHYALVRPGSDYAAMGVEGLMQYFTGQSLPPPFSVPPKGKSVLNPKAGRDGWRRIRRWCMPSMNSTWTARRASASCNATPINPARKWPVHCRPCHENIPAAPDAGFFPMRTWPSPMRLAVSLTLPTESSVWFWLTVRAIRGSREQTLYPAT